MFKEIARCSAVVPVQPGSRALGDALVAYSLRVLHYVHKVFHGTSPDKKSPNTGLLK